MSMIVAPRTQSLTEKTAMQVAAVIPVRNRRDVLVRAIRSIQAQTSPVAEIIIVDDASTDDTPDRVLAMAVEDPRIKLLRQPARAGASAARNRGVNAAAADWIAFLDSDDEWFPEKMALQAAALSAAPDSVASFTAQQIVSDDGPAAVFRPAADISLRDLQQLNVLSTTSSALVRRSSLIEVKGFDESLPSCQDWDLWLRLRALGPFAIVREPLVSFYQSGTDRISRNMEAVLKGHEVLFARIESEAQGGPVFRRRLRAKHQMRMSQIYLKDMGQPRTGFAYALRSMSLWPTKTAFRLAVQALKAIT
ncbi:glycosyltransferase family 2 protein [Caulobacter hibisci]|uniref:Glycosyltransferase family 2 protein n=1 Tax=Caulobacter hibisci TaxID=2035993 RepID=A0ABS0T825_9CAUL|nr:glycosyltransferase family A protein [Caulobacter hibisci]MBI1687013.1 glycosyltransferase family 2 protein [Caulobacter hibisci]